MSRGRLRSQSISRGRSIFIETSFFPMDQLPGSRHAILREREYVVDQKDSLLHGPARSNLSCRP